jgi:predicted dehydrogenase
MTRATAALIGLGGIADEHLAKLRWMRGVEVVAVCDLSMTLAGAIADRFEVGAAYDDPRRMLDEKRPDAVHILTPPGPHRELALMALEAGAHVLVEKPIATGWSEYVEMRDAAAAAGRMLVENYNYRFMRAVLKGLEARRAGAIGEPVALDVTMTVGVGTKGGPYADRDLPHFAHALPGGALFNFASHPASMIAAFLGAPDEVRARRRRVGPSSLSDDELRAVVGVDGACATLTLTSHAQPSSFTLALRGTEGQLEVDVINQRVYVGRAGGRIGRLIDAARLGANHLQGAGAMAMRVATARHDYFEGLRTLLDRFYAAVGGQGPPPVPVAEMDAANRLVSALFAPENQL